ncbi:MAG: RNA methyltransferase [Flavobacterium sp.]|nr:MAG: RNA methyltransferase [Flavobacterium sp.]
MITKSEIKLITGLQQKKYRDKYGLFVAEGPKVISELILSGMIPEMFFASEALSIDGTSAVLISPRELQKISMLKTANNSLAVFKIPKTLPIQTRGLIVALDAIRDPGNLGTIIRLCDWFGVSQLVCSQDTVDRYNPKVVQASMGSIARVQLNYTNLNEFIQQSELDVFGADMKGETVYECELPSEGILIMGNEANGISSTLEQLLDHRITIPRFGDLQATESLNVATATGILLSEFRRSTEK